MINFTYARAGSAETTSSLLSRDANAGLIAGGTNLVDLMKRGVTTHERLIDITSLPWQQIEMRSDVLYIGATATNSAVAEHAIVQNEFPLLSLALRAGASPQLRNMATTGGNIMQRTRCTYFYDTALPCNKRDPGSGCSAIGGYNRMHAIFGASPGCIAVHPSDMCVALAALDAVVIVGGRKERRIAFTDFHRLPGNQPQLDNVLARGEIITGIEIPANPYRQHSHYLKIRDRASYAFALVSVAAALDMDNRMIRSARLAMGGVAHKPWRLFEAERYLAGKTASVDTFREAARLAMKNSKAYSHNGFKLTMAPAAVADALVSAANI